MSALLDRLYHLHWVTPEAARSAQPYLGFYQAFLKPHGFKSLINLRGENAGFRWWRREKQVTAALRIAHFDVRLSSRNLPSRAVLAALFAAFDAAQTPLLVKCSGGQDRAALASALYILRKKGPSALAEAEAQFAFWPYLHRPKRNQHWLKQFPAYAAGEAGGMELAVWACERYRPEHFAEWLRARGLEKSFRTVQAETLS
jgi:protein tyrosine/serine phosphatase